MSRIGNLTIFYRTWSPFIHSDKSIVQEEPEGLRQDWTLPDVTLRTALILVTTRCADGRTDARNEGEKDRHMIN
jgi:hypothetical protein